MTRSRAPESRATLRRRLHRRSHPSPPRRYPLRRRQYGCSMGRCRACGARTGGGCHSDAGRPPTPCWAWASS
eukprot:scaffold2840_cov379-Prasinococcus_capsulatus_cf.AAC.2